MPKSIKRTYSRYTQEALSLFSKLIRAARLERKLTTQEVADRAGISRSMLQRIEKGDLKCEIGAVFEVATLVGVQLFHAEPSSMLARNIAQANEKLALLPQKVYQNTKSVDDDF